MVSKVRKELLILLKLFNLPKGFLGTFRNNINIIKIYKSRTLAK